MPVRILEFHPTSNELRNFENFSSRISSDINNIILDEANKENLYNLKFHLEIILECLSAQGPDTNFLDLSFAFYPDCPPPADIKDKLLFRISLKYLELLNTGDAVEEIKKARLTVANKSDQILLVHCNSYPKQPNLVSHTARPL